MKKRALKAPTAAVSPIEVSSGLIALALPLILGLFIFHYTVDVPFWDEFEWAPLILHMHGGTLTFPELWVQHNDHRMFFGKLIALGLARAGGWSQLRECMASLAVVVIGQLFLLGLLRATFETRMAFVLLALDSFMLFSLSQESNWTWGFQTVWFLINTSLFGALFFLAARRLSPGRFALAVGCAFVASFSSLFGLNVWPAGAIAVGLVRPLPKRLLTAWIGFACVAFALYFYHYTSLMPSSSAAVQHATALGSLTYFLVYLGGALGGWAGTTVSAIVGALGLAGFAGAVAAILPRSASDVRRSAAPWFALGSFPILCAALTTLGRAGLGPEQALESRYVTPSTTLWISLLSLGAIVVASQRPGALVRRCLTLCTVAGIVLFAFASFRGWVLMRKDYASRLSYYYIARHVDTATDDDLRRLYPSAPDARADLEALRAIGLGPAASQHP